MFGFIKHMFIGLLKALTKGSFGILISNSKGCIKRVSLSN